MSGAAAVGVPLSPRGRGDRGEGAVDVARHVPRHAVRRRVRGTRLGCGNSNAEPTPTAPSPLSPPPRGGRGTLVAVLAALLLSFPTAAQDLLGIATSSPGSVFHSSATAIAFVANGEAGLPMTVQAFASPNVYLPSVNTGQIAFGVSNVGDVRLATVGEMHFEGRELESLRAVAVMFPLPMAIYVPVDSPIESIADLRGKRVPTGFAGQKTLRPLIDALLATADLTVDDLEQVRVPNVVGGANAFIEGKADAFFFALGAAKVREADAAVGGLRALPVPNTPEALAAIRRHWPVGYLYEATPSPANTGVRAPLHALTHDAVVVASTHTPDADVYALVQAIHDQRDALRAAFGPFGRLDPSRMIVEIPDVDWHPGALAYFRDAGLLARAEP